MSLYERGNVWWYRFRWNGCQYRGSCETVKESEAKKVESLVLSRLMENKALPGSRKIPTLREFSTWFLPWLEALPADRPPKEGTRRYYRQGWALLAKTKLAGMKIDHIKSDDIASTAVGKSPAQYQQRSTHFATDALQSAREEPDCFGTGCEARRRNASRAVD
jgi:hypothetical protein